MTQALIKTSEIKDINLVISLPQLNSKSKLVSFHPDTFSFHKLIRLQQLFNNNSNRSYSNKGEQISHPSIE